MFPGYFLILSPGSLLRISASKSADGLDALGEGLIHNSWTSPVLLRLVISTYYGAM